MKIHPRSSWTAYPPKLKEDQSSGLPYFTSHPEVEFVEAPEDLVYLFREPRESLNKLLKEALTTEGLSDLNYNYAISQNVEGVFVIRGRWTKCRGSENIRVLLLKGKNEDPTDLLKENQKLFLEEFPFRSEVPQVAKTLDLGEYSVHVHDLIEFLGIPYENKGLFTEILRQRLRRLQFYLKVDDFNGKFDKWTKYALENYSPVGI